MNTTLPDPWADLHSDCAGKDCGYRRGPSAGQTDAQNISYASPRNWVLSLMSNPYRIRARESRSSIAVSNGWRRAARASAAATGVSSGR